MPAARLCRRQGTHAQSAAWFGDRLRTRKGSVSSLWPPPPSRLLTLGARSPLRPTLPAAPCYSMRDVAEKTGGDARRAPSSRQGEGASQVRHPAGLQARAKVPARCAIQQGCKPGQRCQLGAAGRLAQEPPRKDELCCSVALTRRMQHAARAPPDLPGLPVPPHVAGWRPCMPGKTTPPLLLLRQSALEQTTASRSSRCCRVWATPSKAGPTAPRLLRRQRRTLV